MRGSAFILWGNNFAFVGSNFGLRENVYFVSVREQNMVLQSGICSEAESMVYVFIVYSIIGYHYYALGPCEGFTSFKALSVNKGIHAERAHPPQPLW